MSFLWWISTHPDLIKRSKALKHQADAIADADFKDFPGEFLPRNKILWVARIITTVQKSLSDIEETPFDLTH